MPAFKSSKNKQKTKQWSEISERANAEQKFLINLHKEELGIKMKQLKLDVAALKYEVKVQTEKVRRKRKEVTATRSKTSRKNRPCGNVLEADVAMLTMSKEERNSCNYSGIPWSVKNIENGNRKISLVVNEYMNERRRRMKKILKMKKDFKSKGKELNRTVDDSKQSKIVEKLAVKISKTKTRFYATQRISRWYKLIIDELKSQCRVLPYKVEKSEQDLKILVKHVRKSRRDLAKVVYESNLSIEKKQKFQAKSQEEREERWNEIEALQQIVYEIKHCDRVFISDKIKHKLMMNASSVFNTFTNNVAKRAHERAVQRALTIKSSVFEDLYKKKSPQDAVEPISEIPNILLIMDQISKVTSDLRKVGIDVLQPAMVRRQVLGLLKRHEEMYAHCRSRQAQLHKTQVKMVSIKYKLDSIRFENAMRVKDLICGLNKNIERTLRSNKSMKIRLDQLNRLKANVQIFSHWKLTKLEQVFKRENTKIKTNSSFNPALLNKEWATQYIQELSTFLHCMHLIKNLYNGLLKRCRGLFMPEEWHKRIKSQVSRVKSPVKLGPVAAMGEKVQAYNFEKAGLRLGRTNQRIRYSILINVREDSHEDELVDPQSRKLLLTFMKPLTSEQMSKCHQKNLKLHPVLSALF